MANGVAKDYPKSAGMDTPAGTINEDSLLSV